MGKFQEALNKFQISDPIRLEEIKKLLPDIFFDNISEANVDIIRKGLLSITNDPRFYATSLYDARIAYSLLLKLAEDYPLNLKDPITKKRIVPENRVFISTGYQFDIEVLVEYNNARLPRNELGEYYPDSDNDEEEIFKELLDPITNERFSPMDTFSLENIAKNRGLSRLNTSTVQEYNELFPDDEIMPAAEENVDIPSYDSSNEDSDHSFYLGSDENVEIEEPIVDRPNIIGENPEFNSEWNNYIIIDPQIKPEEQNFKLRSLLMLGSLFTLIYASTNFLSDGSTLDEDNRNAAPNFYYFFLYLLVLAGLIYLLPKYKAKMPVIDEAESEVEHAVVAETEDSIQWMQVVDAHADRPISSIIDCSLMKEIPSLSPDMSSFWPMSKIHETDELPPIELFTSSHTFFSEKADDSPPAPPRFEEVSAIIQIFLHEQGKDSSVYSALNTQQFFALARPEARQKISEGEIELDVFLDSLVKPQGSARRRAYLGSN